MDKALLEALTEAQQAQDLAHQAVMNLHRKMVKVNPLAAELFVAQIKSSRELLDKLLALEKIGEELL